MMNTNVSTNKHNNTVLFESEPQHLCQLYEYINKYDKIWTRLDDLKSIK